MVERHRWQSERLGLESASAHSHGFVQSTSMTLSSNYYPHILLSPFRNISIWESFIPLFSCASDELRSQYFLYESTRLDKSCLYFLPHPSRRAAFEEINRISHPKKENVTRETLRTFDEKTVTQSRLNFAR
jgi:hypothetical protein